MIPTGIEFYDLAVERVENGDMVAIFPYFDDGQMKLTCIRNRVAGRDRFAHDHECAVRSAFILSWLRASKRELAAKGVNLCL